MVKNTPEQIAGRRAEIVLFLKNGIPGYLFFRTPFAFFDYGKSAPAVFAENLAILIAFTFLGACCASLAKGDKRDGMKQKQPHGQALPFDQNGIGRK